MGEMVLHFWKQEEERKTTKKKKSINSHQSAASSEQRERNDASEASTREMGKAILHFRKETQKSIAISTGEMMGMNEVTMLVTLSLFDKEQRIKEPSARMISSVIP